MALAAVMPQPQRVVSFQPRGKFMSDRYIYKICSRQAWAEAVAAGVFAGSADDLRDGFIHFSTVGQLEETAARHFAGLADLLLVQVGVASLGDALRWEPSRGGQLFPHLYGPLQIVHAGKVWPLPVAANGKHVFPEGVLA